MLHRGLLILSVVTIAFTASSSDLLGDDARPMRRTIDRDGFHTTGGERFWNRPLYGPNRGMFVTTGELPHAAFAAINHKMRLGHFLPGVVSPKGTKWLYKAAHVKATYDPGMMRFVVRDPAWEGEARMELVPLAKADGYAVRITSTTSLEFAFAFGGFLKTSRFDAYQGNREFPAGIVQQVYSDNAYPTMADDLAVAVPEHVLDDKGHLLSDSLKVALLSDGKMHMSLHQVKNGISLGDLLKQPPGEASVLVNRINLRPGKPLNLVVMVPEAGKHDAIIGDFKDKLGATFDRCKERVNQISRRINLQTPDTLVDLGSRSLSVSMDALWYPPVFLHGTIRWGWPGLAGWRMAYGADVCGTYDRTASHCKHYGDNRKTGGLDRKPHPDPKAGLARQSQESMIHSQGGILCWDSYNMTGMWLSFIAHHWAWTGNEEYLRSMWPAIRDAVAYQKRVFDMDGDSLYENFANTYITDAHWHNGGNCTQASAYTYRGNLLATEAARLAGESPEPYLAEAKRIRRAMNRVLWMKDKGVFAEWKDVLGEKLLHPEPELGSIYLSIDCGVADQFQAYQMLRFTEWGLPNHIFEEIGPQPFDGYYRPGATYEFPQPMRAREIKSSNWRPLIVVTSECSPGEQMDTARAYYKLGLNDRAFPIIKAVLRCMVNLTAKGGLVIRDKNTLTPSRSWSNGDVDHCDTLGPSLQCLAEGLFGIQPDMPNKLVLIQPGFPSDWDSAKIELRDVGYTFNRQGNVDSYSVTTTSPITKRLRLVMRGDGAKVKIDGKAVEKTKIVPGICHPFLEVESQPGKSAEFTVEYSPQPLPSLEYSTAAAFGRTFEVNCRGGKILEINDPQGVFGDAKVENGRFSAKVAGSLGHHTAFLHVKGNATEFWLPLDVEIRPPLDIVNVMLSKDAQSVNFAVRNNAGNLADITAAVNCAGESLPITAKLEPGGVSNDFSLSLLDTKTLVPGRNPLTLTIDSKNVFKTDLVCWDLFGRDAKRKPDLKFQPFNISAHHNDNLGMVHAREYLSPRSPYCSLQITTDLFRDWCHSSHPPCGKLDLDVLMAQTAKSNGIVLTQQGIPFLATADGKNISFVSQWDNFPKQMNIPVGQEASGVYLLMASVTNPMQTGVVNGRVVLNLAGGEEETLELVGAESLSWCVDHYPGRYGPLYMIEPTVQLGKHVYATIYHVPLGRDCIIESMDLEAVSNESVIGLMGLTLLCPKHN